MTIEADRQSLIVIALAASDHEDYVLDLARTLGGTDAPELLGVFVENAELLAHARSRRAREILLTGAERALDRDTLERQMRSQAAQARLRFEAASARLGVRNRFEVVRGDILAEPIKRAAAARALVLSLQAATNAPPASVIARLVEARLPRVLLARPGWLTGQNVAALVDTSTESAVAALEAASRIAKLSRSPITVLVPPATGAKSKERLAQTLGSLDIEASAVIELSRSAVTTVAQAARACRARLLVMPAPAADEESKAVDELLRKFPGALMLVRQ